MDSTLMIDRPQLEWLKLNHIVRTPEPIRRVSEEHGEFPLQELAESLKDVGMLHPLYVRPLKGSLKYELVVGDRRYRAAQLARLNELPALVASVKDADVRRIQLAENLHRQDLTPLELADAVDDLRKQGRTSAQIARLLHKSVFWVARNLAVAHRLSPKGRKIVTQSPEKFPADHLYEVSQIPAREHVPILEKIRDRRLTEAQLKQETRELKERGKLERGQRRGRPAGTFVASRSFKTAAGLVVTVSSRKSRSLSDAEVIGALREVAEKLQTKAEKS